jgi:hypothetical protein
MNKYIIPLFFLIGLCMTVLAQDGRSGYYKAIQKGSSTQLDPAQFKKIEEDALKDFATPESYYLLATTFGNTTEKVWAVVYGEAYCNLATDSDRAGQIGAMMHKWYQGSLTRTAKGLSINLTENVEAGPSKQAPFESTFETSFVTSAAMGHADEVNPLSIKTLTAIRQAQLDLWKKFPKTELTHRLDAISSAGHFEAYNFWLFRNALPDEFKAWQGAHQTQYHAWLDWQSKNKFAIKKPDFQRLYMVTH